MDQGRILAWGGAAAIQLVLLIASGLMHDLLFGNGLTQILFASSIVSIIALPLLCRRSWRATIHIAFVAWVISWGSFWFLGTAVSPPQFAEWGILALLPIPWASVILIHVTRRFKYPHYWWIDMSLGLIAPMLTAATYLTGAFVLLLPLNVLPPLSLLLTRLRVFNMD
jgi:hypothetical protein